MGLSTPILTSYKKDIGYSSADGDSASELFNQITQKTSERNSYIEKVSLLDGASNVEGSIKWQEQEVARLQELRDIARKQALDCQSARDAVKGGSKKNNACPEYKLKEYYNNWDRADKLALIPAKTKLSEMIKEKGDYQSKIASLQSEIDSLNKEYKKATGAAVDTSTGNVADDSVIRQSQAANPLSSSGISGKVLYIGLGALALGTVIILIARKR